MGQGRSPWLHETAWKRQKARRLRQRQDAERRRWLRLGVGKWRGVAESDGDCDYRQTLRKSKPKPAIGSGVSMSSSKGEDGRRGDAKVARREV